jgi:hypothetical protein
VSRTDAHVALPVRITRGDVDATAVHDHCFGGCDLPDRRVNVREWLPSTRCRWGVPLDRSRRLLLLDVPRLPVML